MEVAECTCFDVVSHDPLERAVQVLIHGLYVIQADRKTQHLLSRGGVDSQPDYYHEFCQSQTNLVKWKCEPCINVVPVEHSQAKHTANKVEI